MLEAIVTHLNYKVISHFVKFNKPRDDMKTLKSYEIEIIPNVL